MNPPKRGSLASMLPAPAEAPPLPARPAEPGTPEVRTTEVQTPEVRSTDQQSPEVRSTEVRSPVPRKSGTRRGHRAARQDPPQPALPKYLRLERKELLIWPDQVTELSILARRLNRGRGGEGERLTTNTLIRVAVAQLLSRASDLNGTTEDELRASLGLKG